MNYIMYYGQIPEIKHIFISVLKHSNGASNKIALFSFIALLMLLCELYFLVLFT